MKGILLVDKPADWTSFDVVNYVRKMIAQAEDKKPKHIKVGHTGTLDPFAIGLLVLLIGKEYTRQASELSKQAKTYEVTMRLGETSSTGDPEGEITAVSGAKPTKEALKQALKRFTGEIEQTPPAFSAIKINGQRAYKLAREGKEVKIEPRKVIINSLELLDYRYPTVEFVADVSSGTYIRSLVEDLAASLGTSAYTVKLRRTRVGPRDISQAIDIPSLNRETIVDKITVL